MADIVILGGGLTGLSVAYHLEQQGYHDYKLFEKEERVGGLCRSLQGDGFTFDYTGHLLHISDPYFKTFLEATIGFEKLAQIDRRSSVYSSEKLTPYPFQTNLYGMPQDVIIDCIKGFVERPQRLPKDPSFAQWVLANFGAGIAKHFFSPYQEKIFDFPLDKLSASWTGRFVPPTSLEALLRGALTASTQAVGYNAQFFYPLAGGILSWIESIARKIGKAPYTGYELIAVNTHTKTVLFANGHEEPYKQLVSTIPLDFLLQRLQEKSHTNLFRAHEKLICNSVINLNLGIARPEISDQHWIYYPEKKYPFYRLGFPSNLTSQMSPPGCSSISAEISALKRSPTVVAERLKQARLEIKKLFHSAESEIVTEKIITIPHAYVIFDRWRDKHLDGVHEQLAAYHIFSIGRYGAWKYASMQESVLDGKELAGKLIPSPQPINIEHVHEQELT